VLGLRPEHIAETRPHVEPNQHDFEQVIDVVEPMGMETCLFHRRGSDICGRVNPNAGPRGQSMKLQGRPEQHASDRRHTGKVALAVRIVRS
jgi:multiple sugar transport system ATP-binding protein